MTTRFTRAWADLLADVDQLADEYFALPSGCAGWLVRDLVCHLVVDAQDVLITLATPADPPATRTAATYWTVADTLPHGDDPLAALTVRLAAAYEHPHLLRHHLEDVGSAAGRAAALADPDGLVSTQDQVLTVRDYLDAYVLEATLHHLDLTADVRVPAGPPATASLHRARALLEEVAGSPFPTAWSDEDVLLMATGRRPLQPREAEQLGELATTLPLVLG